MKLVTVANLIRIADKRCNYFEEKFKMLFDYKHVFKFLFPKLQGIENMGSVSPPPYLGAPYGSPRLNLQLTLGNPGLGWGQPRVHQGNGTLRRWTLLGMGRMYKKCKKSTNCTLYRGN